MSDPNTPQADKDPLDEIEVQDLSEIDFDLAKSDESLDPMEEVQNQLNQSNDRLLRTQAELDNFRKRSRRELDEQLRYAPMPILRDLLPVVDNLQRAIQSTPTTEDETVKSLLQGINMVTTQLTSVLERHHCRSMEIEEGMEFDPNRHEAISQQPSEEHPPGTVLHVTQIGYELHDRVVRPTQVVVTRNAESSNTTSKSDAADVS